MNQETQDTGMIVCATRGGEGSEPAVQHAIAMARERRLRLTFLYIANLEFMKHTDMGRTALIAEEVRKMGEFIMMTLVEKAQGEGIEADYAVRQGHFRDELMRYLEETHPALLVLGSSKPGTAHLDVDRLHSLMQKVEEQTGVLVELA
jgi:nucleotide-binding universal stress UspA family protein